MKNSVVVTANPANGQVFTSTGISDKDGKEYGFIRVESKWLDMSGAVATVKSLSALKAISKEAFDLSGLQAGMEIDGKILVIESTVKNPFRTNQLPKTQGKDGGVLLFNGLPIYRETEFTSDLTRQSVLVAHTAIAPVAVKSETILNS